MVVSSARPAPDARCGCGVCAKTAAAECPCTQSRHCNHLPDIFILVTVHRLLLKIADYTLRIMFSCELEMGVAGMAVVVSSTSASSPPRTHSCCCRISQPHAAGSCW